LSNLIGGASQIITPSGNAATAEQKDAAAAAWFELRASGVMASFVECSKQRVYPKEKNEASEEKKSSAGVIFGRPLPHLGLW
jgi:hypothetical protein